MSRERVALLDHVVLAASISVICACGRSDPGAAVTVRDSAGIRIVENQVRTDGDSGVVRVAGRTPDLSIGAVDGDSAYQFFTIWGTRRLSDGRIAVLNQSSYEVRVFDAAGRFARSIGRQGQGPGEFGGRFGPLMICPPRGDTLSVVDGVGANVSVFDPAGAFVRRVAMPSAPDGSRLSVRDCTASGEILTTTGIIRLEPGPGVWSDSIALFWVGGDGAIGASLGRFRHHDRYQVARPSGPGVAMLVFGRYFQAAASEGEAFIGDSDAYQVAVHGRDGKLKRLIRFALPMQPVTDSMKHTREETLARAAAERAATRGEPVAPAEQMVYAKTLPPYDRLMSGRDGTLWVRRYRGPEENNANRVNRWDVFNREGKWMAAVDLPPGLDLLDAAPDYVLGAWRNADGVEFVHLYRVRLPSID